MPWSSGRPVANSAPGKDPGVRAAASAALAAVLSGAAAPSSARSSEHDAATTTSNPARGTRQREPIRTRSTLRSNGRLRRR
jgi:hypothetical protein